MALLAAGHGSQIATGAGVLLQCALERVLVQLRVGGQQVFKNAALEGQQLLAEQGRVPLRQLLQQGVLRTCGLRGGFGCRGRVLAATAASARA